MESNSPYGSLFEGADNVWPSLYQIDNNKIAAVTSASRQPQGSGGHYIALTFGKWTKAELKSGGEYWLVSKANNCCLQAEKGDFNIKYRIVDHKENSQKWKVETLSGGYYKIEDQNNRVLTMNDKSSNNDIMVNLMPWENKPTQKWKIKHIGGGLYSITSELNGKSISLIGQDADGNAVIQLLDYNGDQNQRWELQIEDK